MGWWLPENISTFGEEIDFLFTVILILTGITFFLVEGVLLVFLFRYRHREGRKAIYIHGSRRLELIWTVIPALILFSLAVYQQSTRLKAKMGFPSQEEALAVEI